MDQLSLLPEKAYRIVDFGNIAVPVHLIIRIASGGNDKAVVTYNSVSHVNSFTSTLNYDDAVTLYHKAIWY